MRAKINRFINGSKDYPILLGLASGLYPLFYLYNKNFLLVNSKSQFLFFVMLFLILPTVCFLLFTYALKKIKYFTLNKLKVLTVLNFCFFTFFIVFVTFGLNKKKILLASLIFAFVFGVFLYKHFKKVVVFQLILASFAFVQLLPSVYDNLQYSYQWQDQPDDIKDVIFKKRPNIYYLQPDGFVGFDQINRGYYNFDNSQMESFLLDNKFTIYDDFRSNYTSTLTSNSSIFSMKHHYYIENQNSDHFYKSREIIAGNNPVIEIFKNNNYRTNFILDASYLVANRPQMNYDYCNINYNEIPYMVRGFEFEKNTTQDLLTAIDNNTLDPNFYFVREPNPGHIETRKPRSNGIQLEREKYLIKLKEANQWLKTMVREITKKDPNSIIIISSDHGGFVGFSYTIESGIKTTDVDLIRSMFSSVLAVKWPENDKPDFTNYLKSSVNVFRVLFSYLSVDDHYLKNLEPDTSYGEINEDAPSGVYELINQQGEVVFNRFYN